MKLHLLARDGDHLGNHLAALQALGSLRRALLHLFLMAGFDAVFRNFYQTSQRSVNPKRWWKSSNPQDAGRPRSRRLIGAVIDVIVGVIVDTAINARAVACWQNGNYPLRAGLTVVS
jgi:hypothetical protein